MKSMIKLPLTSPRPGLLFKDYERFYAAFIIMVLKHHLCSIVNIRHSGHVLFFYRFPIMYVKGFYFFCVCVHVGMCTHWYVITSQARSKRCTLDLEQKVMWLVMGLSSTS